MTEAELTKLKKMIDDKEKKCESFKAIYKEYQELTNDPAVIRYLELKNKLESPEYSKSKSFNLETEIASAFWHLQIKPVSSNHLYVYIDTYKNNYDADIVHPSHDRVVGYNDPAADYSLYMNLENRDDTRHVPIKDRKKFEADNKILRMFNNNYIQTQILFEKYVLRYGQVKAIDMLYDELKFNN